MAAAWQNDAYKQTVSKRRYENNNRPIAGKKHSNFKKNKMGKASKEKGEHYCEACSKGFQTADELQTHISEHATCPAAGCKFQAHTLIVEKHFSTVHSLKIQGLDKLWSIDTPEKIEEWKAARRKNFPTLDKTDVAAQKRTENIQKSNDRK